MTDPIREIEAMYVHVKLTGPMYVTVLALSLAIFGLTWWLPYRALRKDPKSRLARVAFCAGAVANVVAERWAVRRPMHWLVFPLQAGALIIAIVVLHPNRQTHRPR